jgi:hypothetical protein
MMSQADWAWKESMHMPGTFSSSQFEQPPYFAGEFFSALSQQAAFQLSDDFTCGWTVQNTPA